MEAVPLAAAGGLQEPAASSFPARPSISPVPSPQVRPVASFDNSSQSSTASHHSRPAPLQLSASDVSGSVFPAINAEDLTPPSSAASPTHRTYDATSDSLTPKKTADLVNVTQETDSGVSSRSLSPARRTRTDSTAGSKRTASGHIKNTYHDDTTQARHTDPGRTRASSSASVASVGNVTEISQQLRTKLKYAMVKVQNGWQSRSLDEIESLASASPRSTVSALPGERLVAESPRRQMQPRAIRKWSDSSSSESSRSDVHHLPSSRPSGISEAAMRQQATRGLAPPANIIAGSRRRPSPNEIGGSTGGGMPQDLRRAIRPTSKQRTLSQNAAMEADAVETLLFMASPNNSGYHPQSQSSQASSLRATQPLSAMTSPLRTQFSQTSVTSPKKVAFSDHHTSPSTVDKSALIDRMLDTLPDESEDELNEALALADGRASQAVS